MTTACIAGDMAAADLHFSKSDFALNITIGVSSWLSSGCVPFEGSQQLSGSSVFLCGPVDGSICNYCKMMCPWQRSWQQPIFFSLSLYIYIYISVSVCVWEGCHHHTIHIHMYIYICILSYIIICRHGSFASLACKIFLHLYTSSRNRNTAEYYW